VKWLARLRSTVPYALADTHFDHAEIVGHCDRPFGSLAAMHERLVENWNGVVSPGETVVFVGDLTVEPGAAAFREWIDRLHGEIEFVVGNHDGDAVETERVTLHETYAFEHGGHRLLAVHDPDDAPRTDRFLVHGHHHNLRTDRYPFLDPFDRTSNVGCELTGYEPVPLDELVAAIEAGRWRTERP